MLSFLCFAGVAGNVINSVHINQSVSFPTGSGDLREVYLRLNISKNKKGSIMPLIKIKDNYKTIILTHALFKSRKMDTLITFTIPDSIDAKCAVMGSAIFYPGLKVQTVKHLLANTIFPGFTNEQISNKKGHLLIGAAGLATLSTALYLNYSAKNTYEEYLNSNSISERNGLYESANGQYQSSLIIAGGAV